MYRPLIQIVPADRLLGFMHKFPGKTKGAPRMQQMTLESDISHAMVNKKPYLSPLFEFPEPRSDCNDSFIQSYIRRVQEAQGKGLKTDLTCNQEPNSGQSTGFSGTVQILMSMNV